MKVAIILAGQPRFFRINDSILDLKNKYNADVFIHTWSIKDVNTYASTYSPTIWTPSIEDTDDYISKYNPKEYIIEDTLSDEFINTKLINREITKCSHVDSKNNLFRWFYSINKGVNLAMENNYDVFIITRPDLIIHSFPEIDIDNIMSPIIHNHNESIDSYYIEVSLISIPKKYISEYIDIINKFDQYYDKGYPYAHDHMPFAHLNETGLINNTKQYNTNSFFWEIIRSENGQIKHILK